jgi:hypothetical protein
VIDSLKDAGTFDAVIITDTNAPQEIFDRLAKTLGADKILVPPLLYVCRNGQTAVTVEG